MPEPELKGRDRNAGVITGIAVLAAVLFIPPPADIPLAAWRVAGVALLMLPLVAVMLVGAWLILIWLHPVGQSAGRNAGEAVHAELEKLGAMTPAETRVACVFGLTALGWITRPLHSGLVPAIDDTSLAIAGALALFLLPSGMPERGRLMTWDDLRALPWGVLILFGGGLSLADAINSSGLATWLGAAMGALAGWPIILIVLAATLAMIFLTELTSNTASAATFLPIGGAIAIGIGIDPLALTVPLALAASCAFMLPVATPPNAIVFSSGKVTVAQMARTGLWIDLFGSAAIVALSYPLAGWLFGK